MEQVEGGELHVNSGSTEQPQTSSVTDDERNLNTVAGFTEGYKLARANLDNLVKAQNMKQTEQTNHNDLPITVCPLYLRIQPVLAALPFSLDASDNPREQLFFILVLRDAQHNLERSTVSQSLPGAWLDIPFEQNEWYVLPLLTASQAQHN